MKEKPTVTERIKQRLEEFTTDLEKGVVIQDKYTYHKVYYDPQRRMMTRCEADDDGYCTWKDCPQLKDNEPEKSNRHCPLDIHIDED